jgi:triosephosphate isomerase
MRRAILAANWKMQKTTGEAEAFVHSFLPLVKSAGGVDVVIAPPFTALERVGAALRGSRVALAAQNVNAEEGGAFTGEIAPRMLADLGCGYTIVGHSERRTLYGETSRAVAAKAAALLTQGIRPIICVGESLEEREGERTLAVISSQIAESLSGLPAERAAELVVAYEPIWAIGTGRTATPEMAQEVHALIREQLCRRFGEAGNEIRIQYGGSVKPQNVRDLMGQADIDGALVGGASLDPESFAKIVHLDQQGGP